MNEPSSSFDLAGLKDVDGFGELPEAPGAAAELAQNAPGFELGVGAFGEGTKLGAGAVGRLLRCGLVPGCGKGRVTPSKLRMVAESTSAAA